MGKEYIEREATIEAIKNHKCKSKVVYSIAEVAYCVGQEIGEAIRSVPVADVVEVRHAKWVSLTPSLLLEEFREMEADKFFMCSECKGECQLVEQDDYYDYCPRCGAKMDKEE